MKINAKIIADSVDPRGHRLVSYLITFPRYILAELNTHRMLSKNSASSRAIPFEKLLKSVEENPFIPVAWMKDHKGMQGSEYYIEEEIKKCGIIEHWLGARDFAIDRAKALSEIGVTKQLCNRILEPFMWHTVLISGTEFENFFALRCPQYEVRTKDRVKIYRSRKDLLKDWNYNLTDLEWRKLNKGMADIHMMDLAEAIWDAYNESTPKQLREGDWHIPFGDDIDYTSEDWSNVATKHIEECEVKCIDSGDWQTTAVKIATARCARTSYTVVGEEKKQSLEADIKLHDKFLGQRPLHASPFEHCAKVMADDEYYHYAKCEHFDFDQLHTKNEKRETGWCKNYRGFIQYRALVPNENVK